MSDPAAGPSRGPGRRRRSRRRLLESGVAAASLGLAGCLGVLSGDGGDDGTGNESQNTTPPAGGNGTDAEPDPAQTIDAWPQFQYDAGNSGNPPGTGPTGELEVDWRFEREKFVSEPVISENGIVIAGCDDGTLYAVDVDDGSLRWKVGTNAPVQASPVTVEQLVIVSDGTGLYAYDLETGGEEWSNEAITGGYAPTVSGEMLVVPSSNDNQVYGLDAGSGGTLWEYDVEYAVHGSPAIESDVVYATDAGNGLHAVTLEDGTKRFSASIDEAQRTGPSIREGTVYLGGEQGAVYALDTEELGEERWKVSPGGSVGQSLAVGDEVVVAVDEESEGASVHAIDRRRGDVLWSRVLSEFPTVCAPILVDGIIYCGGGLGSLRTYTTDSGNPQAEVKLSEFTIYGLAVVESTVFASTSESLVAVRIS